MMGEPVKRVLFVNSEITPYLPETPISLIGRYLPQGIQERKKEIRSFMPRYGCINERKNQLHEVIRLSGMNIIISDVDHPLVIKVASISAARMQVYFIDNEDYFRRKQVAYDEKGNFFADNGDRAIFFARGVLETAKKLRWAPDIIHCHGWITHLPTEPFAKNFKDAARFATLKEEDVAPLADADGIKLAQTAIRYSDGVILSTSGIAPELKKACKDAGLPVLAYKAKAIADGSYIDEYNNFYDQL